MTHVKGVNERLIRWTWPMVAAVALLTLVGWLGARHVIDTAQALPALSLARGFGFAGIAALLLSGFGWSLSRALLRRRGELGRDSSVALGESFTRTILDSSLDCIFVLSADGAVTYANRASLQRLPTNGRGEGALGEWQARWPDCSGDAAEAIRTALQTGEARFVGRSGGADEGASWWDVVVARVAWPRSDSTLVATARDITDQRRAEAERAALLALERTARSEAERAARAKDEFVSTLSHELRTPLNAILGWVGVLRRDQSPETLRKAVEVIERNSRRQAQMIDDLLDIGRILAGQLRLDVERVALPAVIEEAVLSAQPSADAKGVRLVTSLGSTAQVRGDRVRLQQVVWNLLSNAIKFTPRGGRVRVTLASVDSQVQVEVSDDGIGISASLLPHVFDRFRQEDGSTTRRHGGLGLGLSIVANLVELHGGTVEAASDGKAQGSRFTIRLPAAVAPMVGPVGPAVHSVAMEGPPLLGLQVLVVDDEEDARDVVARLLGDAGATVTSSGSAVEALRLLKERLAPDVIVSDIGMPDHDGYAFIRDVRRLDEPAAHVPAAALSALARLEDRTQALTAGFQIHLSKPVDPEALVATVASLAGRAVA